MTWRVMIGPRDGDTERTVFVSTKEQARLWVERETTDTVYVYAVEVGYENELVVKEDA